MKAMRILALGLTATVALSALPRSFGAAASGSEFQPIAITASGSDIPAASPAEIQKSLDGFKSQYSDIAGLFTADDFRTPAEKKYLEKVKFDDSDTISKMNAFKQKLDRNQAQMRRLIGLEGVVVGPDQLPWLYKLGQQAAKALELSPNFHIFIIPDTEFNAYTYSYNVNDYDVVIHSALVAALKDHPDAMLALLGHEMGHVKDQAVLTNLVLSADFESRNKNTSSESHLPFYDKQFDEMPRLLRGLMQGLAVEAVRDNIVLGAFDSDAAAADFQRNCERTADRAAVLVTGDAQAPLKLLSLLAYGSAELTADINIDQLLMQIRGVLTNTDNPDDLDTLVSKQGSHPFSIIRLVEVSDFAASKSFGALKTRLAQDPFAQELDIFSRLIDQAASVSAKYKKYLDEKADTDDTLVRMKATDQYKNQLQRLAKGFGDLGVQILGQLSASALEAPSDAIFDEFIQKMKDEKSDTLKQLLAPAMIDLLKKKADAATGDAATELKAKLKKVQDVKDLASSQS